MRKKPVDEERNLRGLGRALARMGNLVVLWSTNNFSFEWDAFMRFSGKGFE